MTEALTAVESALLTRARHDADAVVAAAQQRGRALVDAARRQAEEILASARASGEADAADALRGERSRTRREARARVLGAERTAYDELRACCVERVRALAQDEGAEGRRARVVAEAAERLGPGAEVRDGSDGPVAVLGDRRLSVVPEDQVDRALADLGTTLTGLWSP